MKKLFLPTLIGLASITLLTGCLNLEFGGGTTNRPQTPTVGQQLVDLKQAKDSGAITEAEYEAQKAKVMASK
jgi:hypothetical protein